MVTHVHVDIVTADSNTDTVNAHTQNMHTRSTRVNAKINIESVHVNAVRQRNLQADTNMRHA